MDHSFAPMMAERAARFANRTPKTLPADARDDVARAFAALPVLASWLGDHNAENERKRALKSLADAWRLLAPRVLDAEGSAAELVGRRCRSGERMANAREVMRLRRVAPVSTWHAAVGALRFARLAPVAALRVDAMARALAGEPGPGNEMNAHFAYVDRLTEYFGFTGGGTRDERVRRMVAVLS
jgi:hypothetical protein